MSQSDYHVATYYFPNFHVDPQNEYRHGKGWTEWEVLKCAIPRFKGHVQPKIPQWGYEDESSPEVMAKKINVATEHCVDTFLFDWYYYDNGAFLNKCLDDGFLKAKNVEKMNFAIMWANHDWCNMHPKGLRTPTEEYCSGKIKQETFWNAIDIMIEKYFSHPSYLRLEGKIYFTIYELASLLDVFGGVEGTKKAMEEIRYRVRACGLGELCINTMVWSYKVLPEEMLVEGMDAIIHELGFDSVSSYVWAHIAPMRDFPVMDYANFRDVCFEEIENIAKRYQMPYYPNVTVGWDPSARTMPSDKYEDVGYPFTPILTGNTPQEFKKAIKMAKDYIDRHHLAKFMTINAWNEWTEGSYLEPDVQYGDGYLKVIKEVMKK